MAVSCGPRILFGQEHSCGDRNMAIGISPLVDFAFKLMLGSPQHSGVTIHFLNSILVDQPKITHIKFLNPFLDKEFQDDKLSILDILATDEHGRMLNIEMQTSLPSGMSQRLAYYNSNLYVGQLHEGNRYTELRPAISICVLTQPMFPESPALHLDFRLRESSSGLILTDDMQIHLLQLNNLRVTAENVYHALPAERWAYFLQNADKLTPEEISRMFPDEEMAEAAGVLEMISQTPEQLMLYNARLKFQRDEEGRLELARQEGEARGRQKGEEIGEARGEARGLKLGRITLLQELLGIRPSTVEDFAGYDEAQLNDIAEQLQQQLRSRRG
ncbi:MAG: Rpn family recombination-promoting nuclease/putative transposase [Planctomycetota bacterium]|nr:MAG: Rpn family recombination-promoting nuclease/putative transposase [Planctomycetota bacterium]